MSKTLTTLVVAMMTVAFGLGSARGQQAMAFELTSNCPACRQQVRLAIPSPGTAEIPTNCPACRLAFRVIPPAVVPASQPQPQPPAPAMTANGTADAFIAWLNRTRNAYGLPSVGHDPNLDAWAAVNNSHQAARGMGHYEMGPARRQNSAWGLGFPGVESAWMNSDGHRSALLDPTIRWVGIAWLGAYCTFNAN